MKKNYLKPELEVISFKVESSILLGSDPSFGGTEDGEFDTKKKDEDRSYGKKMWD